jgi:hypothetical protein
MKISKNVSRNILMMAVETCAETDCPSGQYNESTAGLIISTVVYVKCYTLELSIIIAPDE